MTSSFFAGSMETKVNGGLIFQLLYARGGVS